MKTLVLAIAGAALIAVAGALWIHNDSSLQAAPDIQGDVDCDLDVDAVDALHVLRSKAGLPTTAGCLAAGDVDCDSELDVVDALHILRHVAVLPELTPSGCPSIGSPIDITDVAVDSVVTNFLAADGATPITEIPVDTDFKVEVLTTVTNSGPASVDISIQSALAIPADCSPIPADVSVGLSSVGLGESRTSDVVFTVSCSSPSEHLFSGSGTVSITSAETDTNPANNGPLTDDASIPVTADVDIAASGVTVTAPATATQNVPFDVTVSGSVNNPAGFGSVTADVTFTFTSPDCTTTTPVTDQDQALAAGPNPVQHIFSVTCANTGLFEFTGEVSVVVEQLHVSDSNSANDTGSGVASTDVQSADAMVDGVVVSFFAADGVTPITEIPVDTGFIVEVSTTVTNNGPATVDLEVSNGLAIAADCSPTPVDASEPFLAVPALGSRTSDAQFTVTCSSPSFHQFTGSGTVSITSGPTDTNPSNDGPVTDSPSIPVTADVDLAVSGVTVTAPATATQNVAFDVTVSGSVNNPATFGAVTADVTFTLAALPAGCTTTTPVTDQDQPLAMGANPVQHIFSVTCASTGLFEFTGDVSVVVDQLHVTDSNAANNSTSNTGSTVVQSADAMVDGVVVSFFAADGVTPITDIPVGANFVVQVSTTVTNNGPATVDLQVTNGLATPGDCSPVPVDASEPLPAVPAAGSVTSDAQFTVSCTSPSFHQFSGSGTVSITSGPLDTNPANDGPLTANPSIPVTADVNLAVTLVTVTAPPTATQNVPFDVTVSGSVNNPAGFGSVTADVTFALAALPAGCTTATPVTDQDQALAIGLNPVQHIFSVTCTSTGTFEFTGAVSVAVDQLHVTDSNSANDMGSDVASTDVQP